jgi:hypothetical protein
VFTVHVVGHAGTDVEFVVPSPVVALDLALRADAAGLRWRASRQPDPERALSLWLLRELAEGVAAEEPESAAYLADVVVAAGQAAAARLN